MSSNFREQDACANCRYVQLIQEQDEPDVYNCTRDASSRPEVSADYGNLTDLFNMLEAQKQWDEGHEVVPWGICDYWGRIN